MKLVKYFRVPSSPSCFPGSLKPGKGPSRSIPVSRAQDAFGHVKGIKESMTRLLWK